MYCITIWLGLRCGFIKLSVTLTFNIFISQWGLKMSSAVAWNNVNLVNPSLKVSLWSSSEHSVAVLIFLSWCTPRHCGGGNWLYHAIYCILRNTILCWRHIISQYSSTLSKRVTTGPEQSYVLCNSGLVLGDLCIWQDLQGLSWFPLPDSHVPPACPAVLPRLSRHTKNHTEVKSLPYVGRPE